MAAIPLHVVGPEHRFGQEGRVEVPEAVCGGRDGAHVHAHGIRGGLHRPAVPQAGHHPPALHPQEKW